MVTFATRNSSLTISRSARKNFLISFVMILAVLKYVACDSQLWEAHAEFATRAGYTTDKCSAQQKGIVYLIKNRKGEHSLYKHTCDVNHNT